MPAPASPEALITLREFLQRYALSKTSFYRMCARGDGPPIVKLGRSTRIPVAAAASWLAARVRPASEISAGAGAA